MMSSTAMMPTITHIHGTPPPPRFGVVPPCVPAWPPCPFASVLEVACAFEPAGWFAGAFWSPGEGCAVEEFPDWLVVELPLVGPCAFEGDCAELPEPELPEPEVPDADVPDEDEPCGWLALPDCASATLTPRHSTHTNTKRMIFLMSLLQGRLKIGASSPPERCPFSVQYPAAIHLALLTNTVWRGRPRPRPLTSPFGHCGPWT